MSAEETPAQKYYQRHLEHVASYQKRNPQKMREKNKRFNDKIKENDPDKYQAKLEKSRNYYHTVTKPKKMSEKQATQIAMLFEEI